MKLHIESEGCGKDLVLLHGWGMHGRCWDPVSRRLAEKFRVHKVDLPGHGSSPSGFGDWADILAETFSSEVFVCGWSLGGQLAVRWAARFPERVSKLALVSSTPRFVCAPGWEFGISPEVFSEFSSNLEKDWSGTLKRFLFLQAQGTQDSSRLFRSLQKNLASGKDASLEGLEQGLEFLLETDLRKIVPSVRQSALVLHGDCDRLTPPEAGRWLARNLPNACLEEIPGCAHAPFFSHPELFVSKLTEFFHE